MARIQSEKPVTTPKGAGVEERTVSAVRHNGGRWRRFLVFWLGAVTTCVLVTLFVANSGYSQEGMDEETLRINTERIKSDGEAWMRGDSPAFWEGFFINSYGDTAYHLKMGGGWSIKRGLSVLSEYSSKPPTKDEPTRLTEIAYVASKFKSDSLIRAFINFKPLDSKCRLDQLHGFFWIDTSYRDEIWPCITEELNDSFQPVRDGAALLLAKWGYWDTAEPILMQMQDLSTLHVLRGNMDAKNLLIRLTTDHSLKSFPRISAALVLDHSFNQSQNLLDVSIDLIKGANTKTVDMDTKRAYWLAIKYIPSNCSDSTVVTKLQNLVFDSDFFLADQALRRLGSMAAKGVISAENSLYQILKVHPDHNIRSVAAQLIP